MPTQAERAYDVIVEDAAEKTHHIKPRDAKAIHGLVHVAKRNVDQMHPKERDVHEFSQQSIRDIEKSLRKKLNKAEKEMEDGWMEVEFTEAEVKAIRQGYTDILFDDNQEIKSHHRRVYNLL